MRRHDAHDAELVVFTKKEGLLSKVAHDLRLSLARFEISRDGDTVRGRFWPDTLTVDGAMRDGRLDAGDVAANAFARASS